MLVGIMSDSHGDARATARAVSLLESRGAERLFHCGDICGEQVLDELAGHHCVFVWGNCDRPAATARRYVEHLGLAWPAHPQHATISGKRIGVYHGHERDFGAAASEHALDYLFYGHTHAYSDQMENGCRLINPGALYRARIRTVALLDLETNRLVFLQIENGKEVPLIRAATVRQR
jgi:putative phosphoesterase